MRCTPYDRLTPGDKAWVDWFGAWLTWRKTRDEAGAEAAGPEPVQPDGLLATTGRAPVIDSTDES